MLPPSSVRVALLLMAVGHCAAWSQESNTERLEAMAARARELPLFVRGQESPIYADDEPLLRYSSPDTTTTDGTLWVWRVDDRPVALTAIFLDSRPAFRWNYEFVALSDAIDRVKSPRGWTWAPLPAPPDWHKVNFAPPAETAPLRLSQMKDILQPLTAQENLDGNKSQYRLLARPVLRYTSAEAGVVDGALFAFVAGTNPEVIVQIEARQEPPGWQMAFARQSAAGLTVLKNGKPIWEAARVREWKRNSSYYSHYGPDE